MCVGRLSCFFPLVSQNFRKKNKGGNKEEKNEMSHTCLHSLPELLLHRNHGQIRACAKGGQRGFWLEEIGEAMRIISVKGELLGHINIVYESQIMVLPNKIQDSVT